MSKQAIISDINTKIIGATEVESITPEVVGDILVDIVNEIPAGGGLQSTLDLGPSATFQTDLGLGASSTASTYIGALGFNYNRSECGGIYTRESKITSGDYGPETSYKQFDFQDTCNYSKGVIGFSGAFPSLEAYRNSCSNISRFGFNAPTGDNSFRIPAPNTNCTTYNIPVTVNGCKADIYGNINVSSCVQTPGLDSVLTASDIAYNKAITFNYSDGSCSILGSGIAFYGSNDSQSATYGAGSFSLSCGSNSLSLGTEGINYYRGDTQTLIGINYPTTGDGSVRTLPLSVNGNFADASGNVTVPSGSSLPPHLMYDNIQCTIWNKGKGNCSGNLSYGEEALISNTNGTGNSAIGNSSLKLNTTGYFNTSIGAYNLDANTEGRSNTSVGYSSMSYNISGNNNATLGSRALEYNTTGCDNTSMGMYAMNSNELGSFNVGIGSYALLNNKFNNNVGIGASALAYIGSCSTDEGNVAVGFQAGRDYCNGSILDNLVSSSNSIFIGRSTKSNDLNQTNQIVIGDSSIGKGSNTTVLGNPNTVSTFICGVLNQPISLAPASATASGKAGEIRFGDQHIYVAVADNTWKRSALTTW